MLQNPNLKICGSAVTGYGEEMLKAGLGIDFGIVETVAHFRAAAFFCPDVDFIIDIGGQDIKCFQIKNGAIDSIMLSDENVSYPVITFREEGRVDATAGCNTIGGEYTYAAAKLTFSDNLCQTLMFCPDEEISRNEQMLTQAMDSVLSVATCGKDSLRLEGKHSMLLVKNP